MTINSLAACGTFTLASDGTGNNAQCGAFTITVNIEVANVTAPVVAGDQTVCNGDDPVAFTVTTPASGNGAISYQWQSSTDSLMNYADIDGATTDTYDPPAGITNTTYYRVVASVAGGCSSGSCSDNSNYIRVMVEDCCPSINVITNQQVICSGAALDTLVITTTVTHPDSISFVYFTAAQTDSTLIYNNGFNINTLQVDSGNDTLRLTNVNIPAFTNLSAQADTVYIYAIQAPAPSQATCRPYAEMQVIVLPLPEVTTTITCDDNDTGGDANDDTFTLTVLGTNVTPGPSGEYLVIYNGTILNGSGTAYGMEATVMHADFVANGIFSPTLTIRDIDNGCEVTTTIAPVDNCSVCPTELCLPVKTVIKRGE